MSKMIFTANLSDEKQEFLYTIIRNYNYLLQRNFEDISPGDRLSAIDEIGTDVINHICENREIIKSLMGWIDE